MLGHSAKRGNASSSRASLPFPTALYKSDDASHDAIDLNANGVATTRRTSGKKKTQVKPLPPIPKRHDTYVMESSSEDEAENEQASGRRRACDRFRLDTSRCGQLICRKCGLPKKAHRRESRPLIGVNTMQL